MRLQAKNKMAAYCFHESRTGNAPNPIVMDDTTERISAIFGDFGVGLPIVHDIGIHDPTKVCSKYCTCYFH